MPVSQKKVLILTVGGSCEPLVTSIVRHKPDFICFLCSRRSATTVNGAGLPCRERNGTEKPSISVQLSLLPEQYEIVCITNVDSLADCYLVSREAIEKARESFPGCKVLADYTGGTKSMSVGLAVASLDDDGNVEIYIVGGERLDIVAIRSGTQRVMRCDSLPVVWQRRKEVMDSMFAKFDYIGCLSVLDAAAVDTVAGSAEDRLVAVYYALCRAFLAWDRFDHQNAFELLKSYAKQFVPNKQFLQEIIVTKPVLSGKCSAKTNFSPVHDILLNAERRLKQGNDDDAVSRIYRALELLAQVSLAFRDPPIYTANVDTLLLPEDIRSRYCSETQGSIELPLFRAYELLADLNHPAGLVFKQNKSEILNLLRIRNHSILAHGFTPIGEDKARKFYHFVCKLVRESEASMRLTKKLDAAPQFATTIPAVLWQASGD